jgi:hypothetical protein
MLTAVAVLTVAAAQPLDEMVVQAAAEDTMMLLLLLQLLAV